MPNKSNKISKKYLIVLAVIFAILFLSIGIKKTYESTIISVSNDILKSNYNGGLSITPILKFYNEKEEKAAGILLTMKPGETYKGSILIKNHYTSEKLVHLDIVELEKIDTKNQKPDEIIDILGQKVNKTNQNAVKSNIKIEIKDNPGDFMMAGNELKQLNYVITVPSDTEYGTYGNGNISIIENVLQQTTFEGVKTNITFGGATAVKVIVSENPPKYKTEEKLTKSFEEIVKETFYQKIKLYGGIIFLILTIIFLFFGLKAKNTKGN